MAHPSPNGTPASRNGAKWESRWSNEPSHGKCRRMTTDKKNPTGAGAIIAFCILGGTIIGGMMGQPSVGLLSGTALGALIALLLWLRER